MRVDVTSQSLVDTTFQGSLANAGATLVDAPKVATSHPLYGAQVLAKYTKGFSDISAPAVVNALLAMHKELGVPTTYQQAGIGELPIVWSFQFKQDAVLKKMTASLAGALSEAQKKAMNSAMWQAMKGRVRQPEQDGDFARRSYIAYGMSKALDPVGFMKGETKHNAQVGRDLLGVNIAKTGIRAMIESAALALSPLTMGAALLPYARLLDPRQTLPHQVEHTKGSLKLLAQRRPLDAFYYSFNLDPEDLSH